MTVMQQRVDLRICKVLVIEDNAVSRQLIGAYLRAAGIENCLFAVDGIDGLEKIDDFAPDLVVLDIMMPRMDGFEVCRRIRANPRYRRLPILVQTALETPDERTAVFRAGATDLVTKPIHGPELMARVRAHLENRMLINSLEAYRERVEGELGLAREMQQDMQPSTEDIKAIGERHGLTIEAHFEPSSELGGDHWGLADLGPDKVAVYLVDFAGHGVTAALNTFRLHALMRQIPPDGRTPAAYLGALNDKLKGLLRIGHFCTFLYGIIDTAADTFTFAGAGAPSPIIGPIDGLSPYEASGVPLGIARNIPYSDRVVPFPPGTNLCLYSDALVESPDAEGGMLDVPEVIELMCDHAGSAQPLPDMVERFRGSRVEIGDDLTVLWIRRES